MCSALADDAADASPSRSGADALERLARLLGVDRNVFRGQLAPLDEAEAPVEADHPPSLRQALARIEDDGARKRMGSLVAALDRLRTR